MPESPATRVVTAGRPARTADAALSEPVTFASTYHAGGDVGYGRYGNPTWTALETVLGDLEGGRALTFGSGLAASSAVFSLLPEGAVVVAPDCAYLGVLDQLRERAAQGRLTLRQLPVTDTDGIAAAAKGAAMVWLETPTNPNLDVADVAAVARAARAAGALTVVDNTFATPLRQRPLEQGADIVVHSVTKLLSGHSDVVLGAVVTADDDANGRLDAHRRLHGAIPGPMEAYLALRGLRTLAVRLEKAEATATELASRLRAHRAVDVVRYPGFGTMCSIEVTGGAAGADAVVDAVELWVHSTSLGGVESSLERRRRWPTESPTVDESLIRLSVGIEDVDDLWADLSRALTTAS
ncbi:trans-sulfuration enzyme family protein [Jiangella anatolica]|uniref:homocysteine desulfhydrase n=1 Tax=Jiangella anatolica TaxID=2670374 RepID=A0A2W2AW65_9ACTN|nr:PLP-dependent transferase [Jiangella anatolica]PZF79431.1 cystathionine gamma-synthase [Jiangella anatolica]